MIRQVQWLTFVLKMETVSKKPEKRPDLQNQKTNSLLIGRKKQLNPQTAKLIYFSSMETTVFSILRKFFELNGSQLHLQRYSTFANVNHTGSTRSILPCINA